MNANTPAPPTAPPWYVCQRCGHCCQWPGLVLLDDESVSRITAFLEIDEREFLESFADVRPSRAGLMLKSRPDNSCIFLSGAGCRIHPVKPRRCREFPNGWNFPGWREQCRAIETGG